MNKPSVHFNEFDGTYTATVFFDNGLGHSRPGFDSERDAARYAEAVAAQGAPLDEDEGWQADHEAGCKETFLLLVAGVSLAGLTTAAWWLRLVWV